MNLSKTSLISYYQEIEHQIAGLSMSTGKELDGALRLIDELEENYQTYLKTNCWILRFFINLSPWKSSVHGSYSRTLRALAGRVAVGYEDKILTLLFCKHFLTKHTHRSFCALALDQVITNISITKEVQGFVWKVVNDQGVTNYLIGTIHMGTRQMAYAKGIQEAIHNSDRFFTEKGLILKIWKSSYFPLYSWDLRFSFILDRYIAQAAAAKDKPNYLLDNFQMTREVNEKVKEIRSRGVKNSSLHLDSEIPSSGYFGQKSIPNDPRWKKVRSELSKAYSIQLIQTWMKGQERDVGLTEDTRTLCDERTKAWLHSSYGSFFSRNALPGLIDQIRHTQKPICIAVGALHCTGSEVSLVDEFQKAGFSVSRCE